MLRSLSPKAASPTDPTDGELLRAFRASGASTDLLPLYERYAELIYTTALRYLATPQRAEDAGMEIWELLCDKIPRHEITNFRSWLQTTVRNHCLMQLRREKRDPLQQSGPDLMQSDHLLHPGNRTSEESDVDVRPLYHCLKQLREEQARCVRLFYLQEGESYQTIAEQLKLSVGQVRSHLQNGRRNLKICLEKQAPSSKD